MQARASAAKEEFYARLRAQYNVVVEDGPPDAETAKP
jgi:hypothetical protein